MDGLNRATLLGNLGADPELRFTQSGQAVLNIRLATTESYLDKERQRKERTDWHSVTVWGKRGEALSKILTKGSTILVEGAIHTSSYEDRDGVKRYKTEITAQRVILAGGKRDGGDARSGAGGESGESGGGSARGSSRSADDGDGGQGFGGGTDDDIPF